MSFNEQPAGCHSSLFLFIYLDSIPTSLSFWVHFSHFNKAVVSRVHRGPSSPSLFGQASSLTTMTVIVNQRQHLLLQDMSELMALCFQLSLATLKHTHTWVDNSEGDELWLKGTSAGKNSPKVLILQHFLMTALELRRGGAEGLPLTPWWTVISLEDGISLKHMCVSSFCHPTTRGEDGTRTERWRCGGRIYGCNNEISVAGLLTLRHFLSSSTHYWSDKTRGNRGRMAEDGVPECRSF